jgi:hypothetical protein
MDRVCTNLGLNTVITKIDDSKWLLIIGLGREHYQLLHNSSEYPSFLSSMMCILKDTKQGTNHANNFEPLANEDGDSVMEQLTPAISSTTTHTPPSLSNYPHGKKMC